ncbi:AtpZ/AtpI family protein [Campylobacter concisus]
MAKLKVKDIVVGAEQLSLGISMVVAVAIGTGLGYLVKKATNFTPALWIGFAIGIAAAILNVYKAYKAQIKSLDELKDESRYKGYTKDDDEDD